MSAHDYCPGHGTEPTGDASDLRVIECSLCARDEELKAVLDALTLIPGTTAIYPKSVALTVLNAVRPLIGRNVRTQAAAEIRKRADEDGQWIGPTDPDSILRMAARIVEEGS
jgi:hypothetical protein